MNAKLLGRAPGRLSRRVRFCFSLLLTCLVLVSCKTEVRPDLVLVTLDTLRADHLGCYGYFRDTTPFLDSLAARGVLFENAIAASSTTVPSHATILSGLHPSQHGARANGERVRSDVRTVAQILGASGYRSAAFVSTTAHFQPAGLDRGFFHFEDPDSHGGETDILAARETVHRAVEWLSRQEDKRPLFLWIHLWDPHTPYQPVQLFTDDSETEAKQFVDFMVRERCADLGFFDDDPWKLRTVMDSYDGEVKAVDDALRALFDHVGALRRRPAVWVVTGDHGEGLGNHDWLLHGLFLNHELLQVPLIIHATDARYSPSRISTPAAHADIFPTLMELAGGPVDGSSDHLAGRSLLPLLNGETRRDHGLTFSERRRFNRTPAGNIVPQPATPVDTPGGRALYDSEDQRQAYIDRLIRNDLAANFEIGQAYAVSDERYTLIYRTALGDEFFDRSLDPCERRNLIGTNTVAESRLREGLTAILTVLAESAKVGDLVDPEALDRLETLGYVP